jgi:hypothetical protein
MAKPLTNDELGEHLLGLLGATRNVEMQLAQIQAVALATRDVVNHLHSDAEPIFQKAFAEHSRVLGENSTRAIQKLDAITAILRKRLTECADQ